MQGTGKSRAKVMAGLFVLSLVMQAASFAPPQQAAHAAAATTITVDGVHESAWGTAVGTDPQGDMTETNLDVSTLYVVDDPANFYIGFDAWATSWGMHYGIAIDTDSISGSGATGNPWGRAVDTVAAHRPEYYLNVWHPGNGTIEDAQLNHWDGSAWSYPSLASVGGEQAYRQDNHWIEYRIPKAALGGASHISLELFTTGGGGHAQDTVPSDPNVPYTEPEWGSGTTTLSAFVSYVGLHVASHDNNVEYDGLGHNSQDLVYRQPFGATNPGTQVTLRFRTFHNDVTSVRARFYDTDSSQEFYRDLQLVGDGIGCYQASLASELCDFYETKVTPTQLTTLYYRFIITDGTAVAYYADDNFKDGGVGVATPNLVDNSYPITVFDPSFRPIPWMKDAVIYQIFPDRFRNGRSNNDPTGNEPRYGYPSDPLDRITNKAWSALPEGYCRDYTNPATPCTEAPRGRDYFGGDLKGVDQQLDYLTSVGVNTLYFNPIFDSASDHGYDTQDYFRIDPFFGTQQDWNNLVRHAQRNHIRIVLDGVFNHVSSDSKYFDRYGHFTDVGACESVSSPYRSWFTFHDQTNGPCAGPNGPHSANYDAWFGFDSLPVLNKAVPAVQSLFYGSTSSVGPYWLNQGASGWRLDVMGDGSFPASFWQGFRQSIKATNPNAPIIGELWKKDEILPMIHGDQADTTMNYRYRNAILGFFGTVDNKGFPDDGQSDQPPTLFARKLNSLREDYPDATYYTLMNLMDSHDTKRILWSLTPGQNNREDKEFNAANLALGKQRLKLATVVQFTIPGAPTIYYGDEVGMTGADDPDDRRTFPWEEYTPGGDPNILSHYRQMTTIRKENPVLRDGALTFLLTDDNNRTLAYGMKTADQVAIVAINRNETGPKTLNIPLSGYLRDNVSFYDVLNEGGTATSSNGFLNVTLPALGAAVFIGGHGLILTPPRAPRNLVATEGNHQVRLNWGGVDAANSYNVYRSRLSGGGYQLLGNTTARTYTDNAAENAKFYYYVVTAVDLQGNESKWSNEASAVPSAPIGWAGHLWPPTVAMTIDATQSQRFYAQVYVAGVTDQSGQGQGVLAQFAYGPTGSDPATWTWLPMTYNTDVGNNDEYRIDITPEQTGSFQYLARFSTNLGRAWTYAFTDDNQRGALTVNPSSDVTPPAAPANLHVLYSAANAVALGWNANSEPDLYRYEVWRSITSGGPYTRLATVPEATTQYVDTAVSTGSTYYYVLTAQDTSFNRSPNSAQVSGTAQPRQVAVTITVTVPANTPMGDTVHIAGGFPAPYPTWDPGGLPMTRLDQTHAQITLTMSEGTNVEYKYTRGSWDAVEKGPSCEEISNRQLTVVYGPGGTQAVSDTVAKWRDLDNCP